MAKERVHGCARVRHRGFQVHAGRCGLLACGKKRLDPALDVVERLVDIRGTFHGLTTARHIRLGVQRAQGLQGGGPFFSNAR